MMIEVRYREKLFLQIFAGILMIQSGYYINSFHGIFGIYDLPYWISVIVSLFVFVVIVNALNLMRRIGWIGVFFINKVFFSCRGNNFN